MVTGSKAKNQRGASVQVHYLIEIQEIKPWPPSQSLSSLRSVLLQWENGDRGSGSTSSVIPSVGSGMGDGKIIFNETFRVPVTLSREFSAKGGADDTFQKNCLEFNLYEPRRDKTVKGQLLGTAIIDLAEYGVIKETVTISSQMNCKRSFRNTVQPLLFIKMQPFDKHTFNSSSKGSLSKNAFSDKNDNELVSSMTNEESEVASSSGDNVSTHSSLTFSSSTFEITGCSPSRNKENAAEAVKDITRRGNRLSDLSLDPEPAKPEQIHVSSRRSSIELLGLRSSADSHGIGKDGKGSGQGRKWAVEAASTNGIYASFLEMKQGEVGGEESRNGHTNPVEDASSNIFLPDVVRMPVEYLDDPKSSSIGPRVSRDRPRHAKPVESLDSARSNSSRENQFMEVVKEIDFSEDACNGVRSIRKSERKDTMLVRRETRNELSDSKLQQLEHRIEKLEGELREAAAVEVSLYSIVAEHGSSTNKVHAPARRLSRPYLHACKQKSQARKASAAKSAVSGLVLVAKACGSDVPRLTFWLSNSVVLRAIISQAIGVSQQPICATRHIETISGGKGHDKRSPMKWKESFPIKQDIKVGFARTFDDWENPNAFTNALEKIEAWIFSRIVESVWWQSFTPHMQSASVKASQQNILGEQEQVNYSLDLWKKVFKDAYDKICPVGAGGHECGCLPVLARLVMEQCVSRLDVAMFNAVLRDSTDEMPTDPVSDPISDLKVLPISAGKSSFGAGAQLKNAIGNWLRWLTDLFSVADDDYHEDHDERLESRASFKSFYHLNALSELMMLPKDMLLDRSIRKEVCPTFDASLIKKILKKFLPDEFCQDSIPAAVFEALDSERSQVDDEESIRSIAVTATPLLYLPPAADTIDDFVKVGSDSKLRKSRSSVLRKSYTSDNELDELESPITSIITNTTCASSRPNWKPKENEGPNTVRYQLLREIWRDGD